MTKAAHTVKRVDEVVPHRHLVTQDQTTQVSNLLFANVELVRQSRKVSKAACGGGGREPKTYRTTIFIRQRQK